MAGEVYRARDVKLGRDVAIKILPDTWLADPDRRARFDREARLLASLNHPNVAAIYGIEEYGGLQLLVLELVEGVTLAARLNQISTDGGAMPRWRRDGMELFFLAANQIMMAVPVATNGQSLSLGAPVPLFRTRLIVQGSESSGFPRPTTSRPTGSDSC
jgi:hypothetical protein